MEAVFVTQDQSARVFLDDPFVYETRMGAATYCFVSSNSTPMEKETRAIARGLRRRDPDVLDGLVERYHYRLFRYLLYLTGRRETAEDLFQETWLRVLERGRQYDGKSKFEAWLFTIARHLVIDRQRRRQFWREERLDQSHDAPKALAPEAKERSTALELVARRETSEQLGTALGCLPATYREVLVLRFQEEMTLDEIADVVAAPLSTVKSRLYRSLEAMRQLLEGGQE